MSWDTEQGASTQFSDEVFLSCFITFIEHITQDARVTLIALHFIHPAQGVPTLENATRLVQISPRTHRI